MATIDELPGEIVADLRVSDARPLSGGDTAHAYWLETPDGPLFAKTMPGAPAGVLALEAAGLEALRAVAPAEGHTAGRQGSRGPCRSQDTPRRAQSRKAPRTT